MDIIPNDLIVFANGVRVPLINKKIKIHLNDINCCSICNKQIDNKNIKKNIKKSKQIDNSLIEFEIETMHKECKRLKTKYNKLRDQLTSIDFQIFCLEK